MEALVNNIITATGWSIFHSLWQGTLLYGLLLLCLISMPKLSSRTKHNLAFLTMSMIFSCFCLTFFSLFTWSPLSSVSNSLAIDKVIPVSMGRQVELYFPILVGIYGIGVLLQVAILSAGYHKLWKLNLSPKVAVPKEWQILFDRVVKELKINSKVRFYLSEQVNVPLVLGYLKPVVLFPIAFASQLEMAHVEAILIHEMAHIRRNDFLLNLLKTVMETILFFNPFTWLCSSLIEREREHACDDMVVQKTHTPLTYAHALLQIELINEKQTPVFSMAASGNSQNLYQRIKRITDMKTTYNNAKQQLLAITVTVLTLVSLAWINPVTSKATGNNKKVTLTEATVTFTGQPVWAVAQDTLKNKKTGTKKKITRTNELPAPPPPAPPAINELPVPAAPPAPLNSPAPPVPPVEIEPAHIENMKKHADEISRYYQSTEWKKNESQLRRSAAEIEKLVKSDTWKRQVEQAKRQGMAMANLVNTPAFRKQIEGLKLNSKQLAIESKKLEQHFNSQEWKNHLKEMESLRENEAVCDETATHSSHLTDEVCSDNESNK